MRTAISRVGVVRVLLAAAMAGLGTGVAAAPALALKDVRVELLNNTGQTLEISEGYYYTLFHGKDYLAHLNPTPRKVEPHITAEFTVNKEDLLLSIHGCSALLYSNHVVGEPTVQIGKPVADHETLHPKYEESFAEGGEHSTSVLGNSFVLRRVDDADGYKNFKTTVQHCS